MIDLDALAEFLDQFLAIHRFGEDQGGVYRASVRPIHRLGLALEPWPELSEWARGENLDALFLHRPWKLQPGQVGLGVLSYHLAFDECLTLGFNPRLAIALGMSDLEVLGEKAGRPIGMFGKVPTQSFARYATWVQEVFGMQDQAAGAGAEVSQVAVVGAMTDKLVREAAVRGAEVYVTGQLRQPAHQAVIETGIRAIAVGHRRSEEWGLQALAGVLRERWSGLEVVLPDPNRSYAVE